VIAVDLQILSTDTYQPCGLWSVLVCIIKHWRHLDGRWPAYCSASEKVPATHLSHQTRECVMLKVVDVAFQMNSVHCTN